MLCLHSAKIGSIDFTTRGTKCATTPLCPYFLNFSNAPWLRSFRLPWGLGGKKRNRRERNLLFSQNFSTFMAIF